MIPSNITEEHIFQALAEINQIKRLPPNRESEIYDLLHEGKRYPPKYVISLANKYANNRELPEGEFKPDEMKSFFKKMDISLIPKNVEFIADSIIIASIGRSDIGWNGYEEKDITLNYIPREAWNFFDFNDQEYFGFISDKSPSKFNDGGLVIFTSIDRQTKKRIFIGFYSNAKIGKFSLPVDISDTITNKNIQLQFKQKFNDPISLKSRQLTADKSLSTCFFTPVEFELEELGVKNWSQAPFMYVGTGKPISKENSRNLILKALQAQKDILAHAGESDKEKIASDISKTQKILERYFTQTDNVRYWKMAPGENARFWDEWKRKGIIAIGFRDVVDSIGEKILHASSDELQKIFANSKPDLKNSSVGAKQLIYFLIEMKPGDYVVVNNGKTSVLGWGIVQSEAEYDESSEYSLIRKIEWKDDSLNQPYPEDIRSIFRLTIIDITKEEFEQLVSFDKAYWAILPSSSKPTGDQREMWEHWESRGIVSIQWKKLVERLGNKLLNFTSKEEYESEYRQIYPVTQADMVWKFIYEMKKGDIILLNDGHKSIFARGTITSPAKIFEGNSPDSSENLEILSDWPIYREVTWEKISPEIPIPREIEGKFSRRVIALEKSDYDLMFGTTAASKQKTPAKQYPKKQIIFYGPPGTGKTYSTIIKAHEIIFGIHDPDITYRRLQEKLESQQKNEIDVSNLTWLRAIILAFHENQKDKVSVDEIKNSNIIQEYSLITNNHTIRNTIWSILQDGSRLDSETVKQKRKSGNEFFDKDAESNWYLTEKGKEYQKSLVADYQEKKVTCSSQFSFVTFHQSFSYEDFVEGIRPVINDDENSQITYRIKPGIFMEICKKAELDPGNNYVLVIDEINRGNISKIFGELITLLEDNKRKGEKEEISVKLPYSGEEFYVPNNVYIIGTMNSTDKSIALVDIALRRRFHFERLNVNYDIIPNEEAKKFLQELNHIICAIKNPDYEIGHFYFMNIPKEDEGNKELKSVFTHRILPLLEEYFFSDWEALATVLGPESIKIESREKIIWDEDLGLFKGGSGDYDKIFGRCIKPANEVFEITLNYLNIRTQNQRATE